MADLAPVAWREIGPSDHALHAAFVDYVRAVFPGADFARWIDWNLWDDSYRLISGFVGGQIVANVGLQRMSLLLGGRPRMAWQWGAVGVRPAWRGRGLGAEAIRRADRVCGDHPALLYANDRVRDFYPRFGFQPAASWRFGLRLAISPGADPSASDASSAQVRRRFLVESRHAAPMDDALCALDAGRIACWYLANGFARPLRNPAKDVWVSAGVEDEVLHVEGVWAPDTCDLLPLLPAMADRFAQRVEFGFAPHRWLPASVARAVHAIAETQAHLFVRGFSEWPDRPAALSPLSRT